MDNQKDLMVKMILDAWHTHIKRSDAFFNSITDEQLLREVSPGRNRGVYLLGHLAAAHDHLLPLLGLGDALHPELIDPYLKNPDNKTTEAATPQQLRASWKEINETLDNKISALTPDEWLEKHTSVSAEDFVNEPHRNRLNALLGRTTHLAYHFGQVAFLKSNTD